jgi:hypothetical protein
MIGKKNVCLLCLAEKNMVGPSDLFFDIFFILLFSEFGSRNFLYLMTVLNTLSTVIDDIIPFGSRGRQNFQEYTGIINFPIKSFRVGVKKQGRSWDSKHILGGGGGGRFIFF